MRRLVSVIPTSTFGGAHNQALQLHRPLAEAGWRQTVVLSDEDGNAIERLQAGGVEVIRAPMQRLRMANRAVAAARVARDFPAQVRRLRAIFEDLEADVVQVHGVVHPQPLIAARRAGAGTVTQLLDTRAPQAVRRATMPVIRPLTNVFMSTGWAVARCYPGATRRPERVVPYMPPVDVGSFSQARQHRDAARRALGLSDRFTVGAVGNRNPQKGYEDLIAATSGLDVDLRIVGSESLAHPGYAEHLSALAAKAGLGPDAVGPIPEGHDVRDVLGAFDLLVVSSVPLSEGIPTVILEARAAGLPVVTTDVGSVREVIRPGEDGLVVPTLDGVALREAVGRVASDPDLARTWGERAQAWAHAEIGLERTLHEHLRAYELAVPAR